jgi:predicted PurR-regulated permease PerM
VSLGYLVGLGILAAVLRFVHYIGALTSAVFPLTLEAAVEYQCRACKLLFSLIMLNELSVTAVTSN